jgi:hypothetical protein
MIKSLYTILYITIICCWKSLLQELMANRPTFWKSNKVSNLKKAHEIWSSPMWKAKKKLHLKGLSYELDGAFDAINR